MKQKSLGLFPFRAMMILALIVLATANAWADKTMYVIAERMSETCEVSQCNKNGVVMDERLKDSAFRLTFYYGERPTNIAEGTGGWQKKDMPFSRCIFNVPSLKSSGSPD